MNGKMEKVAAIAGKNAGLADKLDQVLVGPNDRAFVVCSATDCMHQTNGRCTIFTVFDVPSMKTRPCEKYQAVKKEL